MRGSRSAISACAEASSTRRAAAYSRSAALFTGNAATHVNLGLVLQWSGRLAEAEAQFREARRCDPADADARFGLATTLLKLRQSDEGWALYAQGRAGAADWPGRRIPARPWNGEPFAEGALIVDADQGIGDVLQLARFLPRARERVPRLVVYLQQLPGARIAAPRDDARHRCDRRRGFRRAGRHRDVRDERAAAPVAAWRCGIRARRRLSHATLRRGESLVGARRGAARAQGRHLLGRQSTGPSTSRRTVSTGAARSPRSASHGSPPSPASASSACKKAPRAATRPHSARASTTGPTSSPISAKPRDWSRDSTSSSASTRPSCTAPAPSAPACGCSIDSTIAGAGAPMRACPAGTATFASSGSVAFGDWTGALDELRGALDEWANAPDRR